ncbi:hypothetical protein C8Q77DRAFT_1170685 [Trametes polyzona]|nr:hypothetical protein C8Q77DRAFT_1170685 [Trametes polyzona]
MIASLVLALAAALPLASGHASIWHPSMYGFNVTDKTFPYDNRPVAPLMDYTFDQWWFHGHLGYPPNPGDFFELPAGKPATTEITCHKGATTWFNSSEGGDIRQGDSPCPNSGTDAYHTTGFNDLKGCALAIAYEPDVTKIKPEDFTVFSINQTCVWTRFTDFQVPARMPPCPPGGCHCAWFWIHSQDSGGEQNYMTGFKCNVTGSTSNVPLAKPQIPRRCGADPDNGKHEAAPGNCTYGAKQPFYWFQKERNNMFEGTYSPPFYTDLYNFKDGAQDDIFVDSYPNGLPAPSPNSTFVPTPFLGNGAAPVPSSASESQSIRYASSASVSVSSPAGSDSSTLSSAGGTFSASATSFSASTLSPTAPLPSSTSFSSSLSPELPLSTHSATLSPPSSLSSASPSESMTVSTSTVVSTLVVTVTAGSPGASAATSAVSHASVATSSSSTGAAPRTTIFLNGPSSGAAAPASSLASANQTGRIAQSQSSSASANQAAPTIDLNFAVAPNTSSQSVRAAVRPGVFAASAPTTKAVCKRQFRRKVALRRRSVQPEPTADSRSLLDDERDHTILSRISVPGLKRHRKLQQRSSLWNFF